jgi:hypothetical protein
MGNDSKTGLTEQETSDLRSVAATTIPASTEFDLPGADDPVIFADILASLGRDLPHVRQALAAIAAETNGAFATWDQDRREACIAAFYPRGGSAAATLGRVILACYYRDDRVLRSIGHEPRPPFPKGNTIDQGDWSLLDTVRNRPPFWRDDRTV